MQSQFFFESRCIASNRIIFTEYRCVWFVLFWFIIWMAYPWSTFISLFFLVNLCPISRMGRVIFFAYSKIQVHAHRTLLSHTWKRPLNCRVNIVRFFEELKIPTHRTKETKHVYRVHPMSKCIGIVATRWSRPFIMCASTSSCAFRNASENQYAKLRSVRIHFDGKLNSISNRSNFRFFFSNLNITTIDHRFNQITASKRVKWHICMWFQTTNFGLCNR